MSVGILERGDCTLLSACIRQHPACYLGNLCIMAWLVHVQVQNVAIGVTTSVKPEMR
jgi:hypothetical protein